ncbi:hypothetical protein AAII07_48640 [Microvirga sp. 0TCS3.31]|jgi:hypothetical protein
MEPDPIDKIKAGCFDTIGMLVEFTDKRQPFRALLRGRVKDITAKEALTKPLNLRDVAAGVSHDLGESGLAELEADLQAECTSVHFRPGITEIWQSLRERRPQSNPVLPSFRPAADFLSKG